VDCYLAAAAVVVSNKLHRIRGFTTMRYRLFTYLLSDSSRSINRHMNNLLMSYGNRFVLHGFVSDEIRASLEKGSGGVA